MQQHAATPHARAGETFLLSECYASIQGESSFVGTPTIFVRLYTCNLRCAWCDSMHAVEGGDYREVTVADLATEIRRLAEAHGPRRGLRHICWTGGGAPPPGAGLARYIMDVKCPGSGMKAVKAFENLRILRREDEVKFVLADRTDYEFARDVVATHQIPAATPLFSPVTPPPQAGTGLDPATLAAWILEDRLDVRLQPQVHKYIWPGKEREIRSEERRVGEEGRAR